MSTSCARLGVRAQATLAADVLCYCLIVAHVVVHLIEGTRIIYDLCWGAATAAAVCDGTHRHAAYRLVGTVVALTHIDFLRVAVDALHHERIRHFNRSPPVTEEPAEDSRVRITPEHPSGS